MASKSSYTPASWSPGVNTYTIYLQPQLSDGTLGNIYVFDCYFSGDIVSELKKTQHPVQTGGNISDHAYLIPITIPLEVGMSDTGVSFNNSWDGASAKSVNSYTVLQQFQQDRQFVNFTCKFGTFSNLLVDRISAHLDKKTIYGLRASIVLSQTYLVSVTTQVVSARSATTSTASQGSGSTTSVSSVVDKNNATSCAKYSGETGNSFCSTNTSTQSSFIDGVSTGDSSIFKNSV